MNTRIFLIAIFLMTIFSAILFTACGGDDNGESEDSSLQTSCPNQDQLPVFVDIPRPFEYQNAEWLGENGVGQFTADFLFSSYPADITVRFFRLAYYNGEPVIRELVDPSNHESGDGSLRAVNFSAAEVVELAQSGMNLFLQLETDYIDSCFTDTAQNFQFLLGPSGSVTFQGEVQVFDDTIVRNGDAPESPQEDFDFAAMFDLCFQGAQLSDDPDATMVADGVTWTPAGNCWEDVTFQDQGSALYLEFDSSDGDLNVSELLLASGLRLKVTDAGSFEEIVPTETDNSRTYQLVSRQVWFEIAEL